MQQSIAARPKGSMANSAWPVQLGHANALLGGAFPEGTKAGPPDLDLVEGTGRSIQGTLILDEQASPHTNQDLHMTP